MALRETQLTLARWIRSPEGVAKALAEEDSRARGAAPGAAARRLVDLIRGDDALDATGRLEIYANAYFHRILGVLGTDYPALQGALGSEAFHDLVTSYLLVEPSRHASLRYAGARMSKFLSAHESASGIRVRAPWAANLAEFEWARADVFDALDGPALAREELSGVSPEQFGSLRLSLGSWVLLRAFEYPVDQLWRSGMREAGGVSRTNRTRRERSPFPSEP